MKISFEKYHGAGNDFILVDNRSGNFYLSEEKIALLCDRHYGIGSDGLILIEEKKDFDFEMKYFNSDGAVGSMCGNGGRCAVKFASAHGIISRPAKFIAYDGIHEAHFINEDLIRLSMATVNGIEKKDDAYILNTGSPHFIKFVNDVSVMDVVSEGKKIRYSDAFRSVGINVNFVSENAGEIFMRTYERGVEDETLSCGTGTVAVAIAYAVKNNSTNHQEIFIKAPGGILKVYFDRKSDHEFENVWLEGNAVFVFEGTIEI